MSIFMGQNKIKIIFKVLIFAVLPFALAMAWFNFSSPEDLKNKAQAVSINDACQQEYNQTLWLERLPPDNFSADYTVYQYAYNSCPYKNDDTRPKLFQYGYDGKFTASGNLGIIGGKLFLAKTYKFGGLATSTKTYLFDGYVSSLVYYKIASSSTIFKEPFCIDPAVYNKYATSTIFDKIASSTIFIEQGHSTIFDQCVNWTEFSGYANATIYDRYDNLSLAVATTSSKGFALVYDNKKLFGLYNSRQKNNLNVKFASSTEAVAVSTEGILNKINGTDARWVDNIGPYVGHCLVKSSESGAPACRVGNCQGLCPWINCEAVMPSACKTDRWTWDEYCLYYVPAMDQYSFIKTGEEKYECGRDVFGCYGSGGLTCDTNKNCGSCYKYVSQTCIRDLGYNSCVSSKCIKKEQDCRVGRAIVARPDYNKVAVAFRDGSSLIRHLLYEDAPTKSSLEELIKNIEMNIYSPYTITVADLTKPIYSATLPATIIDYEEKQETAFVKFDASLKNLLLNSVVAENNNSNQLDAYLSSFIGREILQVSLSAPVSTTTPASFWDYDSGAPAFTSTPAPASTPTPVINNPRGYHDKSNCDYSWGWACDADDYNQALEIHFYAEGSDGEIIFLGSAIADQLGEAGIGAVCGGYTGHRFVFPTPDSLKNGKIYAIYAYAINIGSGAVNPLLADSPRAIFNCSSSY